MTFTNAAILVPKFSLWFTNIILLEVLYLEKPLNYLLRINILSYFGNKGFNSNEETRKSFWNTYTARGLLVAHCSCLQFRNSTKTEILLFVNAAMFCLKVFFILKSYPTGRYLFGTTWLYLLDFVLMCAYDLDHIGTKMFHVCWINLMGSFVLNRIQHNILEIAPNFDVLWNYGKIFMLYLSLFWVAFRGRCTTGT